MAKKNPALRRIGRKYHATHRLPWYKPKTKPSTTEEQAPPASKKATQSPPRKKKRPGDTA